jgi:CobQ-like glutamine amidotransferase family enzyme
MRASILYHRMATYGDRSEIMALRCRAQNQPTLPQSDVAQ